MILDYSMGQCHYKGLLNVAEGERRVSVKEFPCKQDLTGHLQVGGGLEPRSTNGLKKVEKVRKQNLSKAPRKEDHPANTFT